MGKKIPGKKHRGVKDPIVQNLKREESLKNKINAPPKDIDFQEVPKSLERIMKLKQMTKEGVFQQKRKNQKIKDKRLMDTSKLVNKEKYMPGMTKIDKDLPVLIQLPNENDSDFLRRVQDATRDFIKEVHFEVKHNIKMKKDDKTGQMKFDKVEMDPVDKMFKEKLAAATTVLKKRKRVKEDAAVACLSKTARRRMRREARRVQAGGEEGEREGGAKREDKDFAWLQDRVAFNEVAHRPPQLTARPRTVPRPGAPDYMARRPGSKPGLLLSSLMGGGEGGRGYLTGRRRLLPPSARRQLDSAQAEAVNAYRKMKAARTTNALTSI